MSKMKLELDALTVQTFATAARVETYEGTVDGHAAPPKTNGCGSEIDACPSSLGCTYQCDTVDFCSSFRACNTLDECPSSVRCEIG